MDLIRSPTRTQAHQRVDAARIVADHPAQRVVRVRRGVGGEGEVVLLRLEAEDVEDGARLNPRQLLLGIDRRAPC